MNEGTPRTYWLCLFTRKTWHEFLAAGATVSAFRLARSRAVHQMRPGDYLLCYLTGVSRFVGALEVTGAPYDDAMPTWKDDAFPCRVPVRVVSRLTSKTAIPVKDLSDQLSMFRDMKGPNAWTGPFRRSPTRWREADGQVVVEAIRRGETSPVARPPVRSKSERPLDQPKEAIGPVIAPGEPIPDETSASNAAAATAATRVVQTTAHTAARGPSLHPGKVRERPTSGPVVRFGRPPTTTLSNWDIRDWSLAQINAYIIEHFSARLVTMDQLHPSPGEAGAPQREVGAPQKLDRERLRIALIGTRWDRDVKVMADRIIAAYERLGR